MVTLFVKHSVNDFATWKRAYDDFASFRKASGVTGAAVYRAPDDPNSLTVTHQFKDLGTAQRFANSEELKTAMQKAGVSGGPPDIWFTQEVESTSH